MLPIPSDKLLTKLIRRGMAGEHCTRLVIDINLQVPFVQLYSADKGHPKLSGLPELMEALAGYKDEPPAKKPKATDAEKKAKK